MKYTAIVALLATVSAGTPDDSRAAW
jgi:hypothetical protein